MASLPREVLGLTRAALNRAKALSTSLRTASGRVGLGSACASRQASKAASRGRSNRDRIISLSTFGRPRADFLCSSIDIIII